MKPEVLQRFIVQGFLSVPPAASVPNETHAGISDAIMACGMSVPNPKFHGMPSPGGDAAGNNLLQAVPQVAGPACLKSPELKEVLTGLLGEGYRIHPHTRTHLRQKGAQTTMWHIDSYKGSWKSLRCHTPNHVMVCYYPQDTTRDMGPTELLPGTQYYCGDHDSPTYGRGCLPHLNDQLSNFSTAPWAFTCKAGSIMVMHYDLWHRALECSHDKCDRLMLKFAAWRTAPPLLHPSSLPIPAWPIAEGGVGLEELFVEPLLDFLRHDVPTAAPVGSPVGEDVLLRIERALNDAEEQQIASTLFERQKKNGKEARRNRVGIEMKYERDVAVVEKTMFVAAMKVGKDCVKEGTLQGFVIPQLIIFLKAICKPRAVAVVDKLRISEFVRLRSPVWRHVWFWMHGVDESTRRTTVDEESSFPLREIACSSSEPKRLRACYKLAETRGGEAVLRSIMMDPTCPTSVRRTAFYGYIACSCRRLGHLETGGGTVEELMPNIEFPESNDYAGQLSSATIRSLDGFDAELSLSPQSADREIAFLIASAMRTIPRRHVPAAIGSIFKLAVHGLSQGSGIAAHRVALEALASCCVDERYTKVVTCHFACTLAGKGGHSGERIVAAHSLSRISAQSITLDGDHERSCWLQDSISSIVPVLVQSLRCDPNRYVKAHVFETLCSFSASVSLGRNTSKRSDALESSWKSAVDCLSETSSYQINAVLSECRSVVDAHDFCRSVSLRRRCPVTTPEDPF